MVSHELLLEAWRRQADLTNRLCSRVTDSNRRALPSADGWPLDRQLAHIHETRYWFLSAVAPELAKPLGDGFVDNDPNHPLDNLDDLKALVKESGEAVGQALKEAFERGDEDYKAYDHPVFFLSHMIYHEGWHSALILLALRLAGDEPTEQWEEENVWQIWRRDGF